MELIELMGYFLLLLLEIISLAIVIGLRDLIFSIYFLSLYYFILTDFSSFKSSTVLVYKGENSN